MKEPKRGAPIKPDEKWTPGEVVKAVLGFGLMALGAWKLAELLKQFL